MKKILASLAVIGLTSLAFAANPYQGAQTDVPVKVKVGAITELYTDVTPMVLNITDAGTNLAGNRELRNVTHLANVPVQVSVQVNGTLQEWTQFHILINPTLGWTKLSEASADKVISLRRDGGVAIAGATEVPGSNVDTLPYEAVFAFDGEATTASVSVPVQYFAQAPNGMPAVNTAGTDITVVWTIAAK